MYQTGRRAKSMSFITHGDLFEIFILYDIMGESLLLRLLLQPLQGEEGSVAPHNMLSFTEYFAWGAHQDREDRRAHHVSFGLRLHPPDPPLFSSSSSL